MKKIFIFALVLMLIASVFMTVCAAEEVAADGSEGLSYSEKEQIIKDMLDKLLAEGDEMFADEEPWEIFAAWVREHSGEIIAGVGGLVTLVGALLVLLRTNPKLKVYIAGFWKSCREWFANTGEKLGELSGICSSVSEGASALSTKVERLEKSVLVLVGALEDVIKLSGADEGKKEIYIKQIEQAKAAIDDEK